MSENLKDQGQLVQLDIVSAEAAIFTGKVKNVTVSGQMGELGLAYGHTSLLSYIKPGQVRVEGPRKEEIFYISGGMLEVQPSTITVLADTVMRAADIDKVAAIKAKERAEKAIAAKESETDYKKAKADLAYATAQLKAIRELKELRD